MSQSKGRQAETRPIFGGIERRLPWPVLACACVVGALLAGLSFSATAHATGASVKAWGYNGEGELGNGTTSPAGCQCIASPVAVSGLSNAVAIAAGDYYGLALRADGTVAGWGFNRSGELGAGATATSGTAGSVTGV